MKKNGGVRANKFVLEVRNKHHRKREPAALGDLGRRKQIKCDSHAGQSSFHIFYFYFWNKGDKLQTSADLDVVPHAQGNDMDSDLFVKIIGYKK